jgi:serine/threonine-protein kinase RsbW
MAEIPNLRLRLSNRPENVLVVRQALSGVADCLELDAIESNDVNTAVTEACNNVVAHAYEGGEGLLEVDVYANALAVIVRDYGIGMPAADERDRDRDREDQGLGGLGLVVIDSLSRQVEFLEPAGGGTEVRMRFGDSAKAASLALEAAQQELPLASEWERGSVELKLAPSAMARAVLPRVLSTLAARAYFSTDRISDVQLVADVLAAKAGDSISGSYLDVGVSVAPRNLELRVGPLHTGQGESLVAAAADGLAPVIERLTDERHRVAQTDDSAEMLELRLVDRGR